MIDYTNYSDKELAKSLKSLNKRSKEQVFLEIYNRYNRIIYQYISKHFNNQSDTNDIFQDVFLKFIDMVNKELEINNIKILLLTITRNLCINQYKKKKELLVDNIEELIIGSDFAESNNIMKILNKGLELLDELDKDVLLLKYYDGLSYEEISELTKLPKTLLKSRLWRAKEKLKIYLIPHLKDIRNEIENNN